MAADPAALTRFLELVACTAGLRTGTLSWFIPAVWAAPAVVETTDWAETDADRLVFLASFTTALADFCRLLACTAARTLVWRLCALGAALAASGGLLTPCAAGAGVSFS